MPSNLSLAVCGDIDEEKLLYTVDEFFGDKNKESRPMTANADEPGFLVKEKVTEYAPVATNLYAVGFKCPPPEKEDLSAQKRAYAVRIALSLLFGRSSDFYCGNYEKGLLNERFSAGFTQTRKAAHIMITGAGSDPELIAELAACEIEKRKRDFFTKEQFLREKKATYADSLAIFDLADDLTASYAAGVFDGYDEFDCIETLKELKYEEVYDAFCTVADTNNRALSIIAPAKK